MLYALLKFFSLFPVYLFSHIKIRTYNVH